MHSPDRCDACAPKESRWPYCALGAKHPAPHQTADGITWEDEPIQDTLEAPAPQQITLGPFDGGLPSALHYSEGKSGVDQIPVEVLLEWGQVFTYGEKKYYRDNWKLGNAWHEFYGSALRHLLAFWGGEDIDPESGLPHLAHALWNVGALRYYQLNSLGSDDRFSTPQPQLPKEWEEDTRD